MKFSYGSNIQPTWEDEMSKPETIKIDEVEYVRKDSLAQEVTKGDVKIVILQRGWIMIGYFERNGSDCTIKKANIIRNWGTTKGLGELSQGPLKDTKLDKCNGTVQFDYLTVVATISVEESKWSNKL